jgi:hypothetical protein
MKGLVLVTLIGGSSLGHAGQFTPDEKASVMTFWQSPGRFQSVIPERVDESGIWRVRLTVAGSLWIRLYEQAKPNPVWESYVKRKLAADRWKAWLVADDANQRLLGRSIPPLREKDIPLNDPGPAGAAPEDLVAACGNPPQLAEAAAPLEHRIRFEDIEIRYQDNVPVGARNRSYRFTKGVQFIGQPVKELSKIELDSLLKSADVTSSEWNLLRAVSGLEGGFEAVNTYDTGYVSVGFIQFACLRDGGGALGRMLADYKLDWPAEFQRDFRAFGVDINPARVLTVVDPDTGAELVGEAAARFLIEDRRQIAVFQRAGLVSGEYRSAQVRSAKKQFAAAEDPITITVGGRTITGKVRDVFRSEAGLATLMDRKVNRGSLDPLITELQAMVDSKGCRGLSDLARFERELIKKMKWRADYLTDRTLTQPK